MMAERILEERDQLAKSPSPIPGVPGVQVESSDEHPGHRASLVNVPVTPGIHLGEYASDESASSSSRPATSYFAHNITKLHESMAQSPTEAASGATSNREVLRRMSLTSGHPRADTAESLPDLDPREANPALGLSGGIISATFCIPHKLQYRKGADWVCELLCICISMANRTIGIELSSWNLSTL